VLVHSRKRWLGDVTGGPPAVGTSTGVDTTIATTTTASAGLMQPMTFWELVRFQVTVAILAQTVLFVIGRVFFKRRARVR